MYNTKYECQYCKEESELFLKTDEINEEEISEEEKDNARDILYKEDFKAIFCIDDEPDFEKLGDVLSELYTKLNENESLMECMTYGAAKFFSEDEETGLCVLYAYDFMYLTHKCVSEYLETGVISEEHINLLKEKLLGH